MMRDRTNRPTIARIWRGRTRREVADEYEAYNYDVGIKPLIEKAMGVQTLREDRAEGTEFITISYWESIEAMSRFTGGDPTRIHHLDRDPEFLIELPSGVQILRILASHGNIANGQTIEKRNPDMRPSTRQRFRLSGGTELSFITAGEAATPAVLLLHGSPSSARMFREVIPELSQAAYVIAPDLPGFGESDVLPSPSFPAFGQAISELLDGLSIGPRYIYLHDYGAPVGFHIAMQAPERVLGLIVQNGNAHRTGLGPQWDATQAPYWSHPTPENEAAATAHLTFEGTRDTYVSGAPPDVVARMSPEVWEEDWRVMNLPGRMDTQRALIRDYGKYVGRFGAIADYLARWQPPALMVWGRHDPFFELAEVLSWMQALPRMEAHVLDAGHKLLETHAAAAVSLMLDFIRRTQREGERMEQRK